MTSADAVAILGKGVYEVLHDLVRGEVAAELLPRRFLRKHALAEHLGVSHELSRPGARTGCLEFESGVEVIYDLQEVDQWIEGHE